MDTNNSKRRIAVGKKFNMLTVIKHIGMRNSISLWEVQCDCGKIFEISVGNLGKQKACGCQINKQKGINLIGKKFNNLTIIESAPKRGNSKQLFWKCKCDCGNETIVCSFDIRLGKTKTCGCQQWKKTHGMSDSSEYTTWAGMLQRCNNPNKTEYAYYGGRGIKVCDRWQGEDGFIHFFEDMGLKPSIEHSLDRKEVNGNYEPSNCRWATPLEQWLNRRNPGAYLTFKRYQVDAKKTAVYPHQKELMGLVYCALSITSEAGEISGKVQKLLRDGPVEINAEFRKSLMLEAGDVLWNLSALANELGVTLDQIARMNLKKLESRQTRNKIQGTGDNR